MIPEHFEISVLNVQTFDLKMCKTRTVKEKKLHFKIVTPGKRSRTLFACKNILAKFEGYNLRDCIGIARSDTRAIFEALIYLRIIYCCSGFNTYVVIVFSCEITRRKTRIRPISIVRTRFILSAIVVENYLFEKLAKNNISMNLPRLNDGRTETNGESILFF